MGKLLIVFTRPFWLDEWHTLLIANRPSLGQVFSDLHRGSDFGPPLVHIITWTLGQILGEITPLSTRIVSFSCVLGAIVFVFLTLRRRIGLAGSVAGALAVASHVLVVAHAIELRFYCLWLLFAAAFAWALMLDGDKPVSRRRDAALAIFSILICMSHWLAVLSLGLMCIGAMASFGRDWRSGLRRVLPAAAGFVVLALSAPLLFGQRASIVEKSWMPDVTFGHIVYATRIFWGGTILILGVLVILVGMLRTNVKGPLKGSIGAAIRDPSIAALVSLIALPVLMMIVSIRQPAMHERYSITVLLAWAPVVAVAVQSLGRVMRGAFYLVLLTSLWLSIFNRAVESGRIAYSVRSGRAALAQACTMNLPVVFQVRHLMYPSTEGPSPKWARCDIRYLAMSNATLQRMYGPGNNQPRFFRTENEFARLHQRLYDYPKVFEQARLDSLPRFLMVAWDQSLPSGYKEIEAFGRAVFPNHRVTRITENLSLFERVR